VDDVASLAAFVAGPEAAYIKGASLAVDGSTNASRQPIAVGSNRRRHRERKRSHPES
jgi:hypothetical protein